MKYFLQEKLPWVNKDQYTCPTTPLDDKTTYKLSYWEPKCAEPVKPFVQKESENILSGDCNFNDKTTYKLSFYGCPGQKPKVVKPEGNMTFSNCPLTHDTVNKVSSRGNTILLLILSSSKR